MTKMEAENVTHSIILKVLEHQQLTRVVAPDAAEGRGLAEMILELRKALLEGLQKA